MSKTPVPHHSLWQKFQKCRLDEWDKVASKVGEVIDVASEHLRKFDVDYGVTDKTVAAGKRIQEAAQRADGRYGLTEKATFAYDAAAESFGNATEKIKQVAEEHGVTKVLTDSFVDPIRHAAQKIDSSEVMRVARDTTEATYGATRRVVKDLFVPTLPTYEKIELLRATTNELNYIAACILQISPEESLRVGQQFGRAVTAKITGAAGTTALLGIVSTFGHAGTGAAISGLSGAAASSANLAWVGSVAVLLQARY